MVNNILQKGINLLLRRQTNILSAAFMIMITALLSQLLGVVRYRSLIAIFGASNVVGDFLVSDKVPNLIFQSIIAAAIASAFIPVFSDYLMKKKEEEAFTMASSLLVFCLAIFFVISLIIAVFAPFFLQLLNPGNGFTPKDMELMVNLMRIIMLSQLLFIVGIFFQALLQSYNHFFIPGLALASFNLGSVIGIIALHAFTGTLLILYTCGLCWSKKTGLLAVFFAVFSTGFIQQAHFGTFDGYLAFFAIACFFFNLCFWQTKKLKDYYLALICIVLGAAAKINFLLLAILPIGILFLVIRHKKHHWSIFELHGILGLLLLPAVFFLSPYYLTSDFRGAFQYERGVVSGTLPVFYSQSFYNTKPVIFQFFHVYPFLLNPLLTFFFIISFVWICYLGLKKKKYSSILLIAFYLLLFLPQAFLFTKWTRYMIPTLPFMYIIIALTTADFLEKIIRTKSFFIKTTGFMIAECIALITIMSAFAFCFSAYMQQDTRISASDWAANHIPSQAIILSETYDIGITPFNRYFSNITLFNFYDLDTNQTNQKFQLLQQIEQSQYIILPSQRVIRSRFANKQKFPIGSTFYRSLLDGTLGFQELYRTSCDMFCTIAYWGDPVFSFEETATVFDRPTVFIFKKEKELSEEEYETMLH